MKLTPLLVLSALMLLGSFGAAHAEVIGLAHPGAFASAGLRADYKRGSKFTLFEDATAGQMCAYLDGNGGASGAQLISMVLYADAGGVPGRKVVEGRAHFIQAGDPRGLHCFPFDLMRITVGDYWVVIHSGATAGVVRDFFDAGDNWYGNTDTFSDGAASPFGAGAIGTGVLSVILNYIPARFFSTAGPTSADGAIASAPLTQDYKRASRVSLPQTGRVSALNAYLVGVGAVNGVLLHQSVRMALYQDANGVPGGKILETDAQLIDSSIPARWNTFATATIVLPQGQYWIAIHSGGPESAVRDFTLGTDRNWYGNIDRFDDGAAAPFGTGKLSTGTLAAYLSYEQGPFTTMDLGPVTQVATPSKGLTANFSRGSRLTFFAERASIDGLSAYIDGNGGTSGAQKLRMAVYRDANQLPGDLVLMSDVVTIAAGRPAGWVQFPLKAQLLFSGDYWFTILSGDTGGVARDFGAQNFGTWVGAADVFANGAATPFGAEAPRISTAVGNLQVRGRLTVPIVN